MSDGGPLINLGDLAKPATVLIEKISEAIGGVARPYQIRRVAKAEAEAEKIHALAQIEITELQRRALVRFVAEETKKQSNIEDITNNAIKELSEDAQPDRVEDDWIANFFDKCKLISDKEMQILWGKVLAGEANNPGKYSKRTVDFLSSIDKQDAFLFEKLCRFGWVIGNIVPLIFETNDDIYNTNDITFNALRHLEDIGLISFGSLAGYIHQGLPKIFDIYYYGTPLFIEFNKESDNKLEIGKVLLSKVGQELAPLAGSKPVDGFSEYAIRKWAVKGIKTYSEWPKHVIAKKDNIT